MLQSNPDLSALVKDAASGLFDRIGTTATLTATAPGRVNLMGEHIDYCDGFVLPLAIDRHIVIAGAANNTHQARIASSIDGEIVVFSLAAAARPGEPKWSNYLRGVIRGFQDRGHSIPGFDAFIVSSIPPGAGLSSSAALECAMATFLEGLLDTSLEPAEKALLCQKAEHDFARVPCGIMDQFASVFGRADQLVLIDCLSREPTLIPFKNPDLTLLIANTGVHHQLDDGGYAERRKETGDALELIGKSSWRDVSEADVMAHWDALGNPLNRRARHIVSETARTVSTASAFGRGDLEAIGPLMAASHDSLRFDFKVSCPELDTMVEIARRIGRQGGVIGSRMTGGGFGGSTITLCETAKSGRIADEIAGRYLKATGVVPILFASRPVQGAKLLH